MANTERHKRLLRLLAQHRVATVLELAQWLDSAVITIRRDIKWLSERKLLTRTHGGAEHLDAGSNTASLRSDAFESKLQSHAERKRAIARYAASLCANDETIIIHGGSTTFMMAEFLASKRLRILTNSFQTASHLLSHSQNEVVLSGGKVYRQQDVILSPFDDDLTKHYCASKLFIGAHSISMLGLMESDALLLQVAAQLLKQAQEIVVLADSSKFSNKGGMFLCSLGSVSRVITDTFVSDGIVQVLERAGIKVVVVAPEQMPTGQGGDAFSQARFDALTLSGSAVAH